MIRIETDKHACEALWDQFSPGDGPWDDWELMNAFHDPVKHEFHFLVHENNAGEADGLIPLIRDNALDRYTLIAGSYPDGRTLWIRTEDFPEFFESLPDRTSLFDLEHDGVAGILGAHPRFEENFAEEETRYFLVPADFGFDFHNHIDSFAPEKRQKFLYDLRNIAKRNPVLKFSEDNEAELFIELVNRNFGAESDYASDDGANELRRVIDELQRSGRLKTLTIEVDGAKQAVSMSLLNNNRMVALYAASNNDYNNLGKLLNVETIQLSCRLRVDEISYMTGMQWKAQWQMRSEPCRTLRKPPAPWAPSLAL